MFKNNIVFLLLGIIANYDSVMSFGPNILREKYVKINRFIGFCEGFEDLPMGYYNVTVTSKDKKAIINAKLIVRHEFKNEIQMVVALKRCKSQENLDSCEDFRTIKFNKMCDLYNKKGIWSSFMDKTTPHIKCPIQPGIYEMKDATLDTSHMLFPADGWFWKASVDGYDLKNKEHLFCHYVEVEIT